MENGIDSLQVWTYPCCEACSQSRQASTPLTTKKCSIHIEMQGNQSESLPVDSRPFPEYLRNTQSHGFDAKDGKRNRESLEYNKKVTIGDLNPT